jgi:hypothetical protein
MLQEVCRGADKSLAFLVSPMGGSQHNQKNFSWMGRKSVLENLTADHLKL